MLTIDIECFFDETMTGFLPEVEADTRLKDPEKIKANIEEKKAKQIEQATLNPLYSRLCCIGYYSDDIQEVDFGGEELSEKVMIENFLKRLQNEPSIIVTWNGYNFDIPFIFKRGLKYGLCKLTDMQYYINKSNSKILDLMILFAGWNKYEKLDNVAKVLLGASKEEFDVKQIPELIKTLSGRELIRRYCLRDCELTYKLGKMMI